MFETKKIESYFFLIRFMQLQKRCLCKFENSFYIHSSKLKENRKANHQSTEFVVTIPYNTQSEEKRTEK